MTRLIVATVTLEGKIPRARDTKPMMSAIAELSAPDPVVAASDDPAPPAPRPAILAAREGDRAVYKFDTSVVWVPR